MVTAFFAVFATTLVLFVLAAIAGRRGARRAHFVLVPLAIVALVVTVILTEQLARVVDLPQRELDIHLIFARLAALLLLPVIVTGLLTVRRPKWRRRHGIAVAVFFVGVAAATGTGIWVFSLGTPR